MPVFVVEPLDSIDDLAELGPLGIGLVAHLMCGSIVRALLISAYASTTATAAVAAMAAAIIMLSLTHSGLGPLLHTLPVPTAQRCTRRNPTGPL